MNYLRVDGYKFLLVACFAGLVFFFLASVQSIMKVIKSQIMHKFTEYRLTEHSVNCDFSLAVKNEFYIEKK
jgi:hypothetical protein